MTTQNVEVTAQKLAYGIEDAAAVIGIGRTKLLELMKAGDGPRSFKLGRRRLIAAEELATWLSMCDDRWGSDTLHREDDVEDDDVDPVLRDDGEHVAPVYLVEDVEPFLGQVFGNELAEIDIVVDEQNIRHPIASWRFF